MNYVPKATRRTTAHNSTRRGHIKANVMNSVAIGLYNSSTEQYVAYERAILWPGGTLEVPADFVEGIRSFDKAVRA